MTRTRGFSLAELVVALFLAGIIGLALARLVISQARFVAGQDGLLQARSSVRAALNVMASELRALTPGGLRAATADSITLRVPYAFGVACQQSGGGTNVSLLPGDSAIFNAATASGYAFRDSTGTWRFVEPATVGAGGCAPLGPAITALSAPGWSPRVVRVTPNAVGTREGDLVYLYQTVRYGLAGSTAIPGRTALWRTVLSTGMRDELVAPFDTGSSFRFLVGSRFTVRTTAPSVLDSVVGLHVRLVGQSEMTPEGRSAPSRFDLTTDIVFRNNAHP